MSAKAKKGQKVSVKGKGAAVLERLGQLRSDIDELDYQLLKLLAVRMRKSQEIALLKHKIGMPIYQKSRWLSLMEDRLAVGEKKYRLAVKFTRNIFLCIHRESVRVQRSIKKV